jgi:hypothetical protein
MKLGENLNLTFGKAIVRNIPESKKRLENFKSSADLINLKYEIFDSIRGDLYVPINYKIKQRTELYPPPSNQYYVGNFLSFLRIHLDVLSKRYSSYIVCDDDTVFNDYNLKDIRGYLPIDWDIIVLGRMNKTAPNKYNETVENVPEFVTPSKNDIAGSQCIAINQKCYYIILDYLLSFQNHSKCGDIMLDELSSNKIIKLYLMLPDVTYQERKKLKPYTYED